MELLATKLTTGALKDLAFLYLQGLGNTLLISVGAVVIGVILGFLIALVNYSAKSNKVMWGLSKFCQLYITIIRGTPMLLQLMIMYYFIFVSLSSGVIVAIIAFGINSSAYVAEIARAGLEGVDSGQIEAGRSLGFGAIKTLRYIVLPQAIKKTIPPMGNEFIVLIKETSVAGAITVTELTQVASVLRLQYGFTPLIVSALVYLALVILLTWALKKVERRLARSDRS